MDLYVGTSGYSYPAWKGWFYPKDLPAKQMLRYYSERFGSVEYNGSFYGMPTAAALEKNAAEVPDQFKFVLKAPQAITHFKRLKGAADVVAQFLEVSGVLRERLGALLFQLPPNFKKDAPRLREFLSLLPARQPVAFEFRHPSWFDQEVFDLLQAHRAALCIAEAEDSVEVPFVSTADWGYMRLRRSDYSDAELKAWLGRVKKQDWRHAFIFFKHEDEGRGPRLAKRLLELAA